jgi:hypothetical protein
MKKLLFFLLSFPLLLYSQINESDTLRVKAQLALSGVWQEGNVETQIFRAKQGLTYRPFNGWVVKSQNSYVYQAFGGTKADEDILSLNFLYLNPERRLYPQVLGFVSTNFRRAIDLRYLLGMGITYQLMEKKNQWLKFSISSEFEKTKFNQSDFNQSQYNGSSSISTWRGTLWINGRYALLDKKLVLTHESFLQPSLQSSDNYRWQADLGLEIPLVKYLNFKINYLHAFESIVIQGQQREDQFLTFGFSIKSY